MTSTAEHAHPEASPIKALPWFVTNIFAIITAVIRPHWLPITTALIWTFASGMYLGIWLERKANERP